MDTSNLTGARVNGQDERALWGVRLWLDVAALSGLTDRELLDRFATGGGHPAQVAFAALVARHGPMVLRACRAVLRDAHAAEDAFQATFLVLVRRGGSLWVRESLGPWLHRVASRVAARARVVATRCQRHERRAAVSRGETRGCSDPQDIGPILHAEIDRLPERYRAPVVLCDLEGRTHEEAAEQLGCPVGTIKSRLTRARGRLRLRLTRRGVLPAAGGLGTLLAEQAASAVSSKLALATAEAANQFATSGKMAAGTVPVAVTLAEGVVNTMALHTLAIRFAGLLIVVLATTGVLVLAADRTPPIPEPVVKTTLVAAAPVPPEKPIPKELQPFQGVWIISLCDTVNKTLYASNRELRTKWRWTVKGDEIVWAFKGEEWKLQLHVDPSTKPMQLDLTYLSGEFKGEKCLGIFEWGGVDGKTLQIAIQDPGAKVARPKVVLPWSSDSQTALIFLRRTEPVDPVKELARFERPWTLRLTQSDPNGWPVPIGKGPDKTGQGSERKWGIKGNEITWTSPDGKEVKASFTIDPNKVPRQIDLTFLSGPNKGDKCIGVYEWLDSGDLWLCMTDPGRKVDRPKDISYATNDGRSMIALDRYLTPTETEVRLLQGVWKFEVCESGWWPVNGPTMKDEFPKWRWAVKGSEMSWTGVSTGDVKVSFAVDPTKSPKEIDFTFLDGPHKGEKCPGIYKLKGGSLWVCLRDPGAKGDRPTDFSSAGTSKGQSLLVLDPVAEKK